MKSCFTLVSKYVCDDCKPKPVLKSPKNSSQSVLTSVKSRDQSILEAIVPSVKNPLKSQRPIKSAAQLKAEKLRKNAEKARKQREKRAELKAKAEAARQSALIK